MREELQHTHWIFGVEAVLVIVLIEEKHNTTLEKRRVNLYCEENRVVSLLPYRIWLNVPELGWSKLRSTVSKLHYLIVIHSIWTHLLLLPLIKHNLPERPDFIVLQYMVLQIVGIRLASRLVRGQGCWRSFAATEDSSSPIKSFTSDRAADDHVPYIDVTTMRTMTAIIRTTHKILS